MYDYVVVSQWSAHISLSYHDYVINLTDGDTMWQSTLLEISKGIKYHPAMKWLNYALKKMLPSWKSKMVFCHEQPIRCCLAFLGCNGVLALGKRLVVEADRSAPMYLCIQDCKVLQHCCAWCWFEQAIRNPERCRGAWDERCHLLLWKFNKVSRPAINQTWQSRASFLQ